MTVPTMLLTSFTDLEELLELDNLAEVRNLVYGDLQERAI